MIFTCISHDLKLVLAFKLNEQSNGVKLQVCTVSFCNSVTSITAQCTVITNLLHGMSPVAAPRVGLGGPWQIFWQIYGHNGNVVSFPDARSFVLVWRSYFK